MAKRRKARKKVARKGKKRAAVARKRKVSAKRRSAKKAQPKRRKAKSKLPPRAASSSSPRAMVAPGPAVTPIAPRPSPFPSSMQSDFPPGSPDGKN